MFHTPAHKNIDHPAGQYRGPSTVQSIAARCEQKSLCLQIALQVLNDQIARGIEYPDAEYRTLQAFGKHAGVTQATLCAAYDSQGA
jgi:hypothetical protein